MKHYILFFLVLFTGSKQACGSPAIQWHQGTVVMNQSREVLVGEISVDETFHLVLLRKENQVQVLQAHRLEAIYFYDSAMKVNRKFVSLHAGSSANAYSLYEIVAYGAVQVVRQLKDYGIYVVQPSAVDYSYYVHLDSHLIPLQFFHDRVYQVLREQIAGDELRQYQVANRLNPNKQADAIQLIIQFNAIQRRQLSQLSMAVL